MRTVLVLCGLLAGCVLDLPDDPGLACDALHPCEAGRACEHSACVDPEALDAGATSDAGPP